MTITDDIKMVVTQERQELQPITAVYFISNHLLIMGFLFGI